MIPLIEPSQISIGIENITIENAPEMLEPGQIGPIQEVADEIFTAEARSPAGEVFYLGMEEVEINETRENWNAYLHSLELLNNESGGMLGYLCAKLNDPEAIQNVRTASQFETMSDQEFDTLIEQLRERDMHTHGRRGKSLRHIRGGTTGFRQIKPTYVAYASATPITGRVQFWNDPSNVPQSYQAIYKVVCHVIMTVGVELMDDRPLFQNRGIFRNPIRLVEGGYSNISTMLHAFTGKVIRDYVNSTLNQPKDYMAVSPLPRMKEILVDAIGKNNLMIKDEIPENLKLGFGGVLDTHIVVPIDNLASLHS